MQQLTSSTCRHRVVGTADWTKPYILVTRLALLQLIPVQSTHGLVPFAQPCQPLLTSAGTLEKF